MNYQLKLAVWQFELVVLAVLYGEAEQGRADYLIRNNAIQIGLARGFSPRRSSKILGGTTETPPLPI